MCMQFECRKNRFLKTLEKLYIPNSPSLAILMYMLCLSLTVCVSIIVIWPLFCYGALVDDLEPWSVNAGSGALVSMFYLLSLPALPRRSVRRVCRGYAAWDWVECQQLPPTYRYIYISKRLLSRSAYIYIHTYIHTNGIQMVTPEKIAKYSITISLRILRFYFFAVDRLINPPRPMNLLMSYGLMSCSWLLMPGTKIIWIIWDLDRSSWWFQPFLFSAHCGC